MASESVSD